MKKIFISIVMGITSLSLHAQNITDILAAVEQNNTALQALKKSIDAQSLENKTGIYLPAPEVEFNYLWGSPTEEGDRKDFKVTQQFDYATLSGKRTAVANQQNALLQLQYQAECLTIRKEAKLLCLDIIYYNALIEELSLRLSFAQDFLLAQQKRVDNGDVNMLEYNNANTAYITAQAEMDAATAERDALIANLQQLNGGKSINLSQSEFDNIILPTDFETWYNDIEQNSPAIAYAKQEVEVSKNNVSLSKALSIPSLTIGYMSENTIAQKFRGVTIGVAVPLWSNKNKVRQSQTALQAAELKVTDAATQLHSQLRSLYDKTLRLGRISENYNNALSRLTTKDLLQKALSEGQITILDYLLQMNLYYDLVNKHLAAERDYQKAYCELTAEKR